MALPSSGPISMDNMNTDRGLASGTQIYLSNAGDAYGVSYNQLGSDPLAFNEFYGLSTGPPPTPTVYGHLLNNTDFVLAGDTACSDYAAFNRATYYSYDSVIQNGTYLYTSAAGVGNSGFWIPSGFRSDGAKYWYFDLGNTGMAGTICTAPSPSPVPPSPSPTPAPTPSPTPTPVPGPTPSPTPPPPAGLSITNGSVTCSGGGNFTSTLSGGTGTYDFVAIDTSQANVSNAINGISGTRVAPSGGSSHSWSSLADGTYYTAVMDSGGTVQIQTTSVSVSCAAPSPPPSPPPTPPSPPPTPPPPPSTTSYLLNSSPQGTGFDACTQYNSFSRATYYSLSGTIGSGTSLYTDAGLTTFVSDGYYSNGTNYWYFAGGSTADAGFPC